MNSIPHRLWNDDAGFIVSIELILISTIAVVGLIAGMASVRDAVISELSDVAGAVQDLNQSYAFHGVRGHGSTQTAGSDFEDLPDFCDEPGNTSTGDIDNCITFTSIVLDEGDPLVAP